MLLRRMLSSSSKYTRWGTRSHHPYIKKFYAAMGLAAVAGTGGYYVYHLEIVPVSGRRRFMNTSPKMEAYLGATALQQTLHQYQHAILPQTHPYTQFIARIAHRLVKYSQMDDSLNWQVFVVDLPIPNAFVLPGGKIFVFTGLLPIAQNEDGMAAVLSHEMAHQIARHSAESISHRKILMYTQLLLSFIIDVRLLFNSGLLDLAFLRPFSRKMETEADFIGLKLMAKASFKVHEAAAMWKRMEKIAPKADFEYMSTHPSNDRRIANIEKWIKEMDSKDNINSIAYYHSC